MSIRTRPMKRILDGTTVALCLVAVGLGAIAIRGKVATQGTSRPGSSAVRPSSAAVGSLDDEAFNRLASIGDRIGPADAPVTIVVYSDYSCGHCMEFEPALEELLTRFPQHVAIVMKPYLPVVSPIPLVNYLAAECAAEQGRFAPFNRGLFRAAQGGLGFDSWRRVADSIRMPHFDRFLFCVRSRHYLGRVRSETEEGMRLGVTGTPVSFVNGIRVVGAVPFVVLDSIVASFLNREHRR